MRTRTRMKIEIKAGILGAAVSGLVLALTFSVALFLRSSVAAGSNAGRSAPAALAAPVVQPAGDAVQGRSLFSRNCAHCHGEDARGDEGPTLFNLAMSDARIAKRIKEGVKGEMPKFGAKLNDADIAAITAYLRTLKD